MKAKTTSSFPSIFALVCVLFIDALGMAILFPLLNPIFMDPASGILPTSMGVELRHFYYGVALALFPLAMFFAAPVLGDISDHIGRKKVLAISLLGAFLSYLLMAAAIPLGSIALFLLGRLIAGLTAGSQPIAQAAIIDVSHPEHKAHNLSIIMGAMAFGWIGGPLLGGFLSDASIVDWFNPAVALAFAAILSFLNYLILQLSFRETLQNKKELARLHLHKGPSEFILAFKMKEIRPLSVIFLIMQLGWGFYFGYIALFLTTSFSMSASSVGLFLGFMAIGFALPSFGMIKVVAKYLTVENAAACALGLGGVIFLLTCTASAHAYVLWPIAILVGLGVGASFSYLLTLFSNRVSNAEQGRIMGITTTISAVSWVFASMIGGVIANFGSRLPLIAGGVLLLCCSALTYVKSFPKKNQ